MRTYINIIFGSNSIQMLSSIRTAKCTEFYGKTNCHVRLMYTGNKTTEKVWVVGRNVFSFSKNMAINEQREEYIYDYVSRYQSKVELLERRPINISTDAIRNYHVQ